MVSGLYFLPYPFLGYPILGLGLYDQKVGYPKNRYGMIMLVVWCLDPVGIN